MQLDIALAEGRRGDTAALFMRLAGSGEEQIAKARSSRYWPSVEAVAHTLTYDAACVGDGEPPAGGGSPFFESAADAIAAYPPRGERLKLTGQGHVVDPQAMASELRRSFGASSSAFSS